MRALGPLSIAALLLAACSTAPGPPETPVRQVETTYHGVAVEDPYRWLEDWSDAEVRGWSDAQNAWARTVLDAIPGRQGLREEIAATLETDSPSFDRLKVAGGRVFALERRPPVQQPFLVAMPGPDRPEDAVVVFDPAAIDPSGSTTIDWYVPAPDGSLVALSLSRGGSEAGDLHIVSVPGGESVEPIIPRVNGGTAGGDVAWMADGSGLFYTRYPRPGERPEGELDFHQQIWFHALGTAADADRYEFGEESPAIVEFRLLSDPHRGRLLAVAQEGDSGRFELHLREPNGTWFQVTRQEDEIVQAAFAPDGSLYVVSRKNAPRGRILQLPAGRPSPAAARTIVEQGTDTIVSDFYGPPPLLVTPSRVWVTYQIGGPTTLRSFDHAGRAQSAPELLPVSDVDRVVALAGDRILYRNQSWTEPPAWYGFDPRDGATTKSALAERGGADFSDAEVVRETVVSKDGTEIPLSVLRRRSLELNGRNPVLLYGYGGYGISRTPTYSPQLRPWLDRGGVYAVAHIRGGGEFGEQWHRQGMLTTKQNVFDDFAAAMRHLVERGYTDTDRLAIMGGSNGGLLMGAMLTQHPGEVRAVVAMVGIYDALRAELTPNGAFNIPEFGTVEDEAQFRALYAYSPYHHVEDGTCYPATLFMTGANDPRVDPMHSRKMTARLQAATSCDRPILLRTSDETGHGRGTPLAARVEEYTDIYAFLVEQLGIEPSAE